MGLMNSLNAGVSGLRAFQTKMDVIGNNIANVDTIGFKSSRVTFAEMLNQTIRSGQGSEDSPQTSMQIGLGVRVSAINRNFQQGSLQQTGRQTDVALEGNGFFMIRDGNQNMLTRSGNFAFNQNGLLVDGSGRAVQGFNADSAGNILAGGTTNDIQVDFENLFPPQVTENVYISGNLDADTSTFQVLQSLSSFTTGDGVIASETTAINDLAQTTTDFAAGDQISFDIVNNDGSTQTVSYTYAAGDTLDDLVTQLNTALSPAEANVKLNDGVLEIRSTQLGDSQLMVSGVNVTGTGNITLNGFEIAEQGVTGSQSMTTTVYDGLGREHTLVIEYTQSSANVWDYQISFLDGEQVTSGETGQLIFDEAGNLTSDTTLPVDFDPGNGASPVNFILNLGNPSNNSKLTQYSGVVTANIVDQDGFGQGQLVDFNIDGDGYINGIYDNGNNIRLAQLAIGDVPNYNGLETIGNGNFRTTSASGSIDVLTANNLSSVNINSGFLEGSNVDLALEFTEMITSQRAYQSNARVITTADELLSEVVNLKR